MSQRFNVRRVGVVLLVLVGVGGVGLWSAGLLPMGGPRAPQNALMVIAPYWYNGTWVFDDPKAGLVREPFVGGIPEMIDVLVADIPDARKGFRLTFSTRPFPSFEKKLTWLKGDRTGNTYRLNEPEMEGWICPALFKYYDQAPPELYVKADPIANR